MSFLYVTENGSTLSLSGGHIVVTGKDGSTEEVPKETITSIAIFGRSQMTTPLSQFCMERGIPVSFFSTTGKYYGELKPVGKENAERLKKQVHLSEDEPFCLKFSKQVVSTKIANQITVLRRYLRDTGEANVKLKELKVSRRKIERCNTINELMGYEGLSARTYFDILNDLVPNEFKFEGRSRMPARDLVNAMLNLGYSMLSKEIYGELVNRELCPYIGFMHQDQSGHASLASDMIEEWRPIIVDSVVMSLLHGREIDASMFTKDESGCFLSEEGLRRFIGKLEAKMFTETKYLPGISKPITFRKAIWHQCEQLARVVDMNGTIKYKSICIR